MTSAPSDLPWNPRLVQPWTREEEEELAAIGKNFDNPQDVCTRFMKAFPTNKRTAGAIQKKLKQIKQGRRGSYRTKESGNTGGKQPRGRHAETLMQQAQLSCGPVKLTAPAAVDLGARSQQRQPRLMTDALNSMRQTQTSPSRQGRQASGVTFHHLNDQATTLNYNTATLASSAAAVGDEAVNFAFQAHSSSLAQQPLPPSSVTDYTVTVTGTGLLFENLPPLHQLLILSPVSYRVIGFQQGTSASISSQLTAPFVFQARSDGVIEGVKVPQGTTKSTSMQPQPAYGQGQGRERRCVESKWTAVDGFTVLFESYEG